MRLPHRFGRYVLTEKLAQGGLAEIFRAEYSAESGFVKEVAVKRLLPVWSDNKQFTTMLVDEAKALVHLSHPNIVQVFELGRDQEVLFISMELVDGVDLRQLFHKLVQEKKSLPQPLLFFIFTEILRALDYAHNKGLKIIHRDISPQNILVSFDGAVKVADFGIAKGLHRDWETAVTQVKGKFSYMSPEQAIGKNIDSRSDLYSLGVVLYEMLAGKKLFEGPSDLAVLEMVRQGTLPPDGLRSVPGELRAVVLKSLQKNPEDRYQTATEFLQALRQFSARQAEQAGGFELSHFLKELFPDRQVARSQSSHRVTHQTKVMEKKSGGARWKWGGIALVALLIAVSASYLWRRGQKITPQFAKAAASIGLSAPLLASDGSIRIDATPKANVRIRYQNKEVKGMTPFVSEKINVEENVPVELWVDQADFFPVHENFVLGDAEPVFVKNYTLQKIAPAVINVQAEPWGYVYIPGVLEKRETPVAGLSVKPGSYTLRVFYEPDNLWAESKLTVAAGQQYHCLANFNGPPAIFCK